MNDNTPLSEALTMPSWKKSATQTRSKNTERALARAARELLDDSSFNDIRIQDVVQRAGASVGGFYARFEGKNALLHLADIDFLEACTAAFDEAVPEYFQGELRDLIRAFISVMVREFGEHRQVIIQGLKHAREDDRSGFRQRSTDFNRHVHGRMRRLLRKHQQVIDHADPERALNMMIFFASAAAREAVLHGALAAYPVELDENALIDELVHSALAYLKGGFHV